MNNLIPMEYRNQRIMTTDVLADSFGTDKKIISNNFNRNIDRFIEGKHYYKLEGEELKEFKGVHQNDESLKYVSVLYLWTERGAARHAKILDTEEAWEVYEALEETYFKVKDKKTLSIEDMMIIQLGEQKKIKNRLQVVENKVENQMTIDYGQQRIIQREVAKRVYERMDYYLKEVYFTDEKAKQLSSLVDIKHTDIFKGIIKKYFNSLYKDLKNRFGVPSYRDIKKRDYNLAINYICNWIEPQELREAS